ncbi:MAG: hypothetical protein ACHQ7N_16150 [Candidatus Methylomirabilales bacterium]
MDEPELGAELTDVGQTLARAGLINVALPEVLRKLILYLKNLLDPKRFLSPSGPV